MKIRSKKVFWKGKEFHLKNLILLLAVRDKITCKEVIDAYIDRIKEVEPLINCTVAECFDDALKVTKQNLIWLQ